MREQLNSEAALSQFSENKRPGRLPEGEPRPAAPDPTLDEKPFRLAKSFSLAAIVLIFASVLTLAAVVSRQAEIIITKRIEDDTVKLMTNLNNQMYVQFLRPVSKRYGRISLGDAAQRDWLNGVIDNTIFGFDLKRVIIYGEDGRAVFATDDAEIRRPWAADDPEAVREAIALYKSMPRLRIIAHDRTGPEAEPALPLEDEAGLPAMDPGSETAREARPEGAEAPRPMTGRKYEPPNPYLFFTPAPFAAAIEDESDGENWNHRPDSGGEYTPGDPADPADPADPSGAPEEGRENGGESVAETDVSAAGPSSGDNFALEENALPADDVDDETGYRVISIGSVKVLIRDGGSQSQAADADSPAAARTIVGDDEFFLDYQRSQTVFRHEGGRYLLFNFLPTGEFVLRAYKVMESYEAMTGPGLSGILEINRDLTPEYRQIARLQYFALGVAVFLSVVLTVALRWVVGRGEAILTKRNQERQALRERLDQAERLAGLGSMVATVAHEIRNPLGIIHSTADVLNRFLAGDPDQARLARAIVEEADRLSTVVTEFLDFARPPLPKPAPVVVEEILEEILAFLEITLARSGVEVRCEFRQIQSAIMGDGPMLHRAFLNVIMNAVQAMDDGGLITVATRLEEKEDGPWLAVSVSDTGPGLTEETAKKMFSPFYTTKAKGTGLGLVIVRNIIEGHGGHIEMISRRPSKNGGDDDSGLTVVIRLKASAGR